MNSQAYIIIDKSEDGSRLDRALLRVAGDALRGLVLRLIRKGNVRVNGKRCKPEYRLKIGDQVFLPLSLRCGQSSDHQHKADLPVFVPHVLYEDEALVVINKPAGKVVHGGSGHDSGLIEQLKSYWQCDELRLAHRLDRDTSGCLLLARQLPALRSLSEQFRERQAQKTYLAWVDGSPHVAAGHIHQQLLKGKLHGGERMVVSDEQGKDAQTDFQTICQVRWKNWPISLMALQPHSGRTHQLRVHMQQEGCPILGDGKYGQRKSLQAWHQRGGKGLCLHAWRLRFVHPYRKHMVEVHAPWPDSWSLLRP